MDRQGLVRSLAVGAASTAMRLIVREAGRSYMVARVVLTGKIRVTGEGSVEVALRLTVVEQVEVSAVEVLAIEHSLVEAARQTQATIRSTSRYTKATTMRGM